MTESLPNFRARLLKAFQNFYIAMTGAYALSVLLFLAGRVLIGERWIVIAFFNTFAHLLWIPALILLPFTLLMRAWRVGLLLLPIVLIFAFFYGRQFMPDKRQAPENAIVLKLLTHNLFARNREVEAILSNIRSTDADFVALQELSHANSNDIVTALAETYPYRAMYPQDIAVRGMGFLSKYPIEDVHYWQFDWLLTPLAYERIQVQINEAQSIVIYNVHPTHPGMNGSTFFDPSWRSREIAEFIPQAENETLPVLLMGDFNMPRLSDDYQVVTSQFEDVYKTVGWGMGWTYPVQARSVPFLRLDYIFTSADFVALESAVLPSAAGSDHMPLRATVALEMR